jgi:hypothetical protein
LPPSRNDSPMIPHLGPTRRDQPADRTRSRRAGRQKSPACVPRVSCVRPWRSRSDGRKHRGAVTVGAGEGHKAGRPTPRKRLEQRADEGTRTLDLLHGKGAQPFAPVRIRSPKPGQGPTGRGCKRMGRGSSFLRAGTPPGRRNALPCGRPRRPHPRVVDGGPRGRNVETREARQAKARRGARVCGNVA